MKPVNRLYAAVLLLLILMVSGTSAYYFLEQWSLLDSLYMTVIVITTIGFKEVHDLDAAGKVFTMIFSLTSYLFLAGIISIISSILFDFYTRSNRREKRMIQKAAKLKSHIVVCGEGAATRYIAEELYRRHETFVLLQTEENREQLESAYQDQKEFFKYYHTITGDPTNSELLVKAGVDQARSLICCLEQDSRNLFVAVSARNFNPGIRITSYVIDDENVQKFILAGVEDVVSGSHIIGRRLAVSRDEKNITQFLEQAARTTFKKTRRNRFFGDKERDEEIRLRDVIISVDSPLNGKSLAESRIKSELGLLIIAIRKRDKDAFIFNPSPDTLIEEGDDLITMGSYTQIRQLKEFASPGESAE